MSSTYLLSRNLRKFWVRQHWLKNGTGRLKTQLLQILLSTSSVCLSKRFPCSSCKMFAQTQKYNFYTLTVEESSNVEKQKPPRKPLRRAISAVYHDYCMGTTLHGFRFLAEERPLKEKIFWICVIIASVYCCTALINNAYEKWNETPVIVSFSEKSTPVWNIPFPAITICSETKRKLKTEGATYGHIFNELRRAAKERRHFDTHNITEQALEEFRTLLQICSTQLIEDQIPLMSSKPINYFDVLDKMLPEFERYFFFCKWFSYMGDCDKLFATTYTEEGICFSFNALNAMDLYREDTYQYQRMSASKAHSDHLITNRTLKWTLESGYDPDSDIKTYPARVLGAGARAGLFLALQSFKQEVDYACRGPVQGFKVLLHSPDDVPLVSKQFVRIPMGREVLIVVKPNMITTSQGIAGYDPLRRQCYLNSERQLRFFKTYTQGNCELECLTNFTLSKCGCVKFSMPRTPDTPVCNEDKISCYDKAEDELLMLEFSQGIKHTTFNYRGATDCNCMPACTSLVYNSEISQGNFDLEQMLEAAEDTEFLTDYPGSQMARLSIFFKENQFITSKRSELYGITDFLANCGGICGLFIGFSFLSIIELVYYFSLRLWSDMRRKVGT